MTYQMAFIFLVSVMVTASQAQNDLSYSVDENLYFRTVYDDIDIVVPNPAIYRFFFNFYDICDDVIIKDMQYRLGKCLVCEDARQLTIACTRTNHTYTGIKIEGTCTNTILRGTEFNNHTRGLWVFGGSNAASNAVLSNHLDYEGNKWLPGFDASNKACYLGDNSSTQYSNLFPPQFKYNPNNADASKLFSTFTTQQSNLWFFPNLNAPNPDNVTFACPTCVSTGTGGTSGNGTNSNLTAPTNPDFSASEIAIAENAIEFGAYENVAKWEAEKTLYEKVDAYNGVIVEGSAIDVFRDSVALTPIKDFAEVEKEVKAAFDVPGALKAQYNSYRIVADNYLLTLAYLDSLNQNTSDSLLQANYFAQMQAIKTQLEATQTQLGQIQTQIETARDFKIDNALALNALLEEGEVYQYNKKVVTDIYLQTLAKGNADLTATQWASIVLIAQQCPYSGGKAVYEARSIYALMSDEVYDDHALCAAVGINARIASSNTSAAKSPPSGDLGGVRLFPNPTTGIIRLFVPTEYQGSDVVITNAVGQTVTIAKVISVAQSIDLSTEPTGIYFITMRQEGKIIYQNKLVKVE